MNKKYPSKCSYCGKVKYYTTKVIADKKAGICNNCSNGIVFYKVKNGYNAPCPNCGIDRITKSKSNAYMTIKNGYECMSCSSNKRNLNRTFSDSKLTDLGITESPNRKWQLVRPTCGHVYEYQNRKIAMNMRLRACSICMNTKNNKNGEVWIQSPIEGFDNYQISNKGRVKNRYERILHSLVMGEAPHEHEAYILQNNYKKLVVYKNQIIRKFELNK